jgi:hypothetical protein
VELVRERVCIDNGHADSRKVKRVTTCQRGGCLVHVSVRVGGVWGACAVGSWERGRFWVAGRKEGEEADA